MGITTTKRKTVKKYLDDTKIAARVFRRLKIVSCFNWEKIASTRAYARRRGYEITISWKKNFFRRKFACLTGTMEDSKEYFTFVFDEIKYLVSYIVYGLLHKYSGHVARGELQTLFAKGRY